MKPEIIMFAIGLVLTIVFVVMYFANVKKYQKMIDGVDKDFYTLPDIFVVGIAVIQMFKLNTRSVNYKKRRKIQELFSKQYVDFNCLIFLAAKISYVMLIVPLSFLMGALTKTVLFVFVGFVLAALLVLSLDVRLNDKIQEQHEEILLDYPNVLSNLALLISSGMMLREAWKTIAESGNRKIYREMKKAVNYIANGSSELQAYNEFADACRINEIKKFVSIICQNVQKGNSELVYVLRELSVEAWNIKKNVVKVRGSNASTKLIIPVMICFAGILIMIMVPIMTSMSMDL